MPGALEGIRVLELTHVLAGPYCAMLLADLGAEVIKIENPQGGDDSRRLAPPFFQGESAAFLAVNRNKYGVALNIRTPEGKELLWKLLATTDVLVENFRPGTLARLGFSYEQVHARHPRIVYCSISGFGQTGPAAQRGGFDLVTQAMSGVLALTGSPEEPAKVGVPISDLNAAMFASHAILASLLYRSRTGEGQRIDTSLFEATLAYTVWESNEYWSTGISPQRMGTRHRIAVPYQVFTTADGSIAIGGANQRNWENLVAALERPDLLQDPRFATNKDRIANSDALEETLSQTFQTRSTETWMHLLEQADVASGPVLNLEQVYQHPQVQARAMDIEIEHPRAGRTHAIGFPVKYSTTQGQVYRPAPVLGQHTFQILRQLDLNTEQLQHLEASGVLYDAHLAENL